MGGWKDRVPIDERSEFFRRYGQMSKEGRKIARAKYIEMNKKRRIAQRISTEGVTTKAELDLIKAERKRLRQERKQATVQNDHMCVYIPHPTLLRQAVCAICQIQRPERMKTVYYNKIRRQYKASMCLWSLCVPLADESSTALTGFIRRNNLETNTNMFHVTLVEGIYQGRTIAESRAKLDHMSQVHDRLGELSTSQCRLRVTDLQAVQTRRDATKALIIVQLEWEHPSAAAPVIEDLVNSRWCCDSLPQWPLHCALGVLPIPNGAAPQNWKQLGMIKQQFLREHSSVHLNMTRLCELPPPHLEESDSQTRMARALSS